MGIEKKFLILSFFFSKFKITFSEIFSNTFFSSKAKAKGLARSSGFFCQKSKNDQKKKQYDDYSNLPPPKDCRFRVPIRTPVRVLDGREAPEKFSPLYIRFPVLGFKIPVPGIFFTAKFGHFLVTCFFLIIFLEKNL